MAPGVTCVRLNRGKFVLVDSDAWSTMMVHKWHAVNHCHLWYAKSKIKGKSVLMHRMILGATDAWCVDHIDGNGLNNSSVSGTLNIRLVTSRQNSQNRHCAKSSKFPGVSLHSRTGLWRALIQVSGRSYSLGYHRSEADAYAAYQRGCELADGGLPINIRQKSSSYKGVTLDKRSGKWAAQAWIDGKHYFLGRHGTEEDDAKAYQGFMLRSYS